jgi:L-alanine-DL-glutamate epimerase-like enolase superfamily enzyme
MKRRDWITRATAMAGTTALSGSPVAGESDAHLTIELLRLELRHTWTTTMSSSDFRRTVLARYRCDGVEGLGEGAPIVRYGEDPDQARRALEQVRDDVEREDPWAREALLGRAFARLDHQFAARAALDIALHDWTGQRLGIPLYRLFGLDPADAPLTTFSIGIDTPEMTRQKVREAEAFPVLKIKVGLDTDEASIDAVRAVTDKPLRVDANEGWQDREIAVRKIEWLASRGVELVEQPVPAAALEDAAWVRERVGVPIFADEACRRARDIPGLAGAYDGVNIKLDKAGGLAEALRMIHTARACGLGTMLGCMISSSVSTTAAAHLSPLVDYADLDGHLLIANDPWVGVQVRQGQLVLPEGAGLGLHPRGSEVGAT